MDFRISIVLDYDGLLKKDLRIFNTLEELDLYTTNFENSVELRNEYQELIDDYLQENKNYLANKKQNKGRICITYYDKKNNLRFFPILFKNKKDLLSLSKFLKLIKKCLDDDNTLIEISKRKKYLLSDYEKDLLRLYLTYKEVGYKKCFIATFYLRILNSSNKYLYLRSLVNVCGLLHNSNLKTKNEIIETNISNNLSKEGYKDLIREEDDIYLINLLASEDYENLFNYYDLSFLETITNGDIPIGIKRLKK